MPKISIVIGHKLSNKCDKKTLVGLLKILFQMHPDNIEIYQAIITENKKKKAKFMNNKWYYHIVHIHNCLYSQ